MTDETKAQIGKKSQKKGRSAEAYVLADLQKRGHDGQLQQQRYIITKSGKRIYPDGQGCDIIGHTDSAMALYVEVKAYKGTSIRISETGGLKLAQLSFMLEKQRRGCLSLFAFLAEDSKIYYILPSSIERYLLDSKKTSYPLSRLQVDGLKF